MGNHAISSCTFDSAAAAVDAVVDVVAVVAVVAAADAVETVAADEPSSSSLRRLRW